MYTVLYAWYALYNNLNRNINIIITVTVFFRKKEEEKKKKMIELCSSSYVDYYLKVHWYSQKDIIFRRGMIGGRLGRTKKRLL